MRLESKLVMTTTVSWLVENKVIWVRPVEEIEPTEMTWVNAQIQGHLQAAKAVGQPKIHVFFDASLVRKQHNPIAAREVFTYMDDPALGWHISDGSGNPLFYFFAKIITAKLQNRARIFENRQQALTFLSRADDEVPDLLEVYENFLADHHEHQFALN